MHWTSGIEIGIRLISWTWIRRLLNDWPEVTDLFEHNELALRQIYWHQRYLAAFRSRGSSANNHVIAEAAGQLVAACAFPWFTHERALAGRRGEPCWSRSWTPTRSRPVSTASSRPTTTASSPSSACTPLSKRTQAGHPRQPAHLGPARPARSTSPRRSSTTRCDRRVRATTTRAGARPRSTRMSSNWSAFLSLGAAVVGRAAVVAGDAGHGDRRPGSDSLVDEFTVRSAGRTAGALRGRRSHDPAQPRRGPGDLVPRRRRAARFPVHRRARALPTRCPSRSGSTASTSWPTPARTATTARRRGGTTSARPSPTTPSRSPAPSSPPGAARSSGCAGQQAAYAGTPPRAMWSPGTADHDGYRVGESPVTHRRTAVLDDGVLRVEDHLDATSAVRMAWHLGPEVTVELDGAIGRLQWPAGSAIVELPAGLSWSRAPRRRRSVARLVLTAIRPQGADHDLVGSGNASLRTPPRSAGSDSGH